MNEETVLHIPYVDDWAGTASGRFYCDCDAQCETYYATLDEWYLHWHEGDDSADITAQLAVERSQQERSDAAERRIERALALHTRDDQDAYGYYCSCGVRWDTTLDRCTSPTVTALLGDQP